MKRLILLTGLLVSLSSVFNNAYGQSAIIRGKILDASNNEPLMAVNIVEIDKNGRFIGYGFGQEW